MSIYKDPPSKHVKPIRYEHIFRCGDKMIKEMIRVDFLDQTEAYKDAFKSNVSLHLGEEDHKHLFPNMPIVRDGFVSFPCYWEEVLKRGPGHPDHPDHIHTDCCK